MVRSDGSFMDRVRRVSGVCLLVLGVTLPVTTLVGCGGGASDGEQTSAKPAAKPSSGGSVLNEGPMAVESVKLNPGLASFGATAFDKRGCTTCHAIGESKQGPDLAGVASRRTEAWMKKMITDPEYMVKNDPIAREMFGKYALQMANQQVPAAEVDAIIQFLVQQSKAQ